MNRILFGKLALARWIFQFQTIVFLWFPRIAALSVHAIRSPFPRYFRSYLFAMEMSFLGAQKLFRNILLQRKYSPMSVQFECIQPWQPIHWPSSPFSSAFSIINCTARARLDPSSLHRHLSSSWPWGLFGASPLLLSTDLSNCVRLRPNRFHKRFSAQQSTLGYKYCRPHPPFGSVLLHLKL